MSALHFSVKSRDRIGDGEDVKVNKYFIAAIAKDSPEKGFGLKISGSHCSWIAVS